MLETPSFNSQQRDRLKVKAAKAKALLLKTKTKIHRYLIEDGAEDKAEDEVEGGAEVQVEGVAGELSKVEEIYEVVVVDGEVVQETGFRKESRMKKEQLSTEITTLLKFG
uniref:Uncharacterized protein n=1 Tax=Heliothis virescens TaxID=7102 RepID=A0A2A4J2E6_HELVI